MDTQIIVVYCLSDDMLTSLHHYEDKQRQMSDAEVMTTAIVAMLYFKGNFCMASRFLYDGNYIPNMLGKSRFNRRLHNIAYLFCLKLGFSRRVNRPLPALRPGFFGFSTHARRAKGVACRFPARSNSATSTFRNSTCCCIF